MTDFQDVQTIRLEQNYRSTSTILKAANQLIANNADRLGKELWTDGSAGEPISVYAAYNEIDEARFIVSKLKAWREQGNSLLVITSYSIHYTKLYELSEWSLCKISYNCLMI